MILVTGVSGFIGKHLLNALINTYGCNNIVALTSEPIDECAYLLHNNYTFSPDFFLKCAFEGLIDTLIHAGSFTPKSSLEANEISFSNSNVINTATLINVLPDSVKRVVYISTLDIYAPTPNVINENSEIAPVSLYGSSKLYCEKMFEAWSKKNNKILQVLRLGHIYGPGEYAYKKLIPETIKKTIKNISPTIYSNGNEKRSFLYINDCISAILNSLLLDEYAGPINIVSSTSYSVKDIIRFIIEISGKNIKPEVLNTDLPVYNMVFDNSKMKNYLTKQETDIKTGLNEEYKEFIKIE